MRHGKKFNHLGRKVGHRKALLRNMASSLILNKRIKTTVAKAKALKQYVEPVITKTKGNDSGENLMNAQRVAFKYLQDKYAVKELFANVAGKVAERNGGYTRIIKLGNRLGDNADIAILELVDFNDMYSQSKSGSTGSKRRRRRGKKNTSESGETADVLEATDDTAVDNAVDATQEAEDKKED